MIRGSQDLCRRLDEMTAHDDAVQLFSPVQRRSTRAATTYVVGGDELFVGKRVGTGANGTVYVGTYGNDDSQIVIKRTRRGVSLGECAEELRLQVIVFCEFRKSAAGASIRGAVDMGNSARIPKPIFAGRLSDGAAIIGMERADQNLLDYLAQIEDDPAVFAHCMRQLATLLLFLHMTLKFMHGDLHDENVMIRHTIGHSARPTVFLIDFGMSSVSMPAKRVPRICTDERYRGVPFNPSLDLLTILTSIREDVTSTAPRIAAWCDMIVAPFWEEVHRGLMGKRSNLRFGARKTADAARDMRADGVYFSHHLLYENNPGIRFHACTPKGLLTKLSTVPSNLVLERHARTLTDRVIRL